MRKIKMKNSRNAKVLVSTGFICILVFALIVLVVQSQDKVYAKVGGYKITQKDLALYGQMEKGSVLNYFSGKYQKNLVEDSDWYQEYDGEKPIQVLSDQAMQRCVMDKLLLSLAKENDIQVPVTYKEIEQERERSNKEKGQALANSKIVYGKKSFSQEEFFGQLITNTKNELVDKLGKEKGQLLYVSDKEVKEYYEANPGEWGQNATQAEVLEVKIVSPDNQDAITAEIQALLMEGKTSAELIETYHDNIAVSTHNFTGESYALDLKANYDVRTRADSLRDQEVAIVDNSESKSVIQVLSKTVDGQEAQKVYGERIRTTLAEQKLDAYLEQQYQKIQDYDIKEADMQTLFQM